MTLTSELPAAATAPRKSRKNNPEKTRENILQEAIVEFVTQGLSAPGWTRSRSVSRPPSA